MTIWIISLGLGWEVLDWSYSMLQAASFGLLVYILLSMLTGHTRCRYDTFLFNTSSRSSLCPPAGHPRSGVSGRKNRKDPSPFARCANEHYTSEDNRDSQNSHTHNSREGMSTGMWLWRDKATPNPEMGPDRYEAG